MITAIYHYNILDPFDSQVTIKLDDLLIGSVFGKVLARRHNGKVHVYTFSEDSHGRPNSFIPADKFISWRKYHESKT